MLAQLKSLHLKWCSLTAQDLKYQPCERILYDYLKAEFTEADLEAVLMFMLHQNSKREPRYRDRLLFHRIMGDLETFNSRLGEAGAWLRNRRPKPTAKDNVLAQFRGYRPPDSTADTARTTATLLQAIAKGVNEEVSDGGPLTHESPAAQSHRSLHCRVRQL